MNKDRDKDIHTEHTKESDWCIASKSLEHGMTIQQYGHTEEEAQEALEEVLEHKERGGDERNN